MRVNTLCKAAALVVLSAIAIGSASAESLWREDSRAFCADRRARAAGDIVTVVIVESSSSTQKATTDTAKSSDLEGGPGVGDIFKNIKKFAFSGKQSTSGAGTTARSASLAAKITCRIVRTLPNGNLCIEGDREVATNKERQILQLSGTIRPEDIAPDNTVLSTYVADAKIVLTGKGIIADRQREGIVTRIIRWLF